MPRPEPPTLPPRPAARRLLAWLYTGPLGHLWSTAADVAALWVKWAAVSVRERAAARYSKR